MFENIIAQEETLAILGREWRGKDLPRALLFYGDPYTGKLSTALELARILSCRRDAQWACDCSSCRRHRVLDHPFLLLTGARLLGEEIAAAADTLQRTRCEAARYLYIRAVRKLTRRFDPILWEGEEHNLNKHQSLFEELEELIDRIYPETQLPGEAELKTQVENINTLAKKIFDLLPKDNIPIDQIRNIGAWTHTTSGDSAKIVILENADRMSDGSKNALLKMLEEPPDDTYYILLTTKKGAIIPTIASRVRHYRFVPRTPQAAKRVLKKIFRLNEQAPYEDLRSYFLAWRGVPVEALRAEAERFIERLLRNEEWEVKEKNDFLKKRGNHDLFFPFLDELTMSMERRLSLLPTDLLSRWNGLIRDSLMRREAYNQAPDVLLESLYYSMKRHAEKAK